MLRRVIAAALLGAAAAQPSNRCTIELVNLVTAGADQVSAASCTALATFEACVSRIEDRSIQSALEVELNAKQLILQGCAETPRTAAIRTERDAIDIDAREFTFTRNPRQNLDIFGLQQEADVVEASVSSNTAAVVALQTDVSSTLAANTANMQATMDRNTASMNSRMAAATAAAAANAFELRADVSTAESQLTVAMAELASTTSNSVSTSVASMNTRIGQQLSTAASTRAATNAALNTSVQAAIVAASNAAVPTVYVQWGARACTAPSGVTITRLYIGIMYGSRHNYNGGGDTNLCLKDAAGDQGGVRQGGQDSNDFVVPVRRDHANYNNMPSRNNIHRAKDNWIVPCAKCKYAKSCFEEAGVAECPSGYYKMYTGWLYGGHQSHHGNNDRVCIDKNPADSDYTSSSNWYGYIYPTIARDGSSAGSRNNRVALACHQCCVT